MNIPNWGTFQHYKERKPPWIKLHRGLLENKDFARLPVASKALAPFLWLLASEGKNPGELPSFEDIAWRLRMSDSDLADALKPLILGGFVDDDSGALALPKQETHLEGETETEEETEEEREGARAETVAEAAMRLAAQNGYKPEPVPPADGKLIDQIACKACARVGHLVTQAPRNGHPVQFYCHQTRGGCGFSIPAKFALDILAQMTPGARAAVEAMIPEATVTPKGRAPSWDSPDAKQAAVDSLASGWIAGHVLDVAEIRTKQDIRTFAEGAPLELRGAVTMILFARNPHLREPAQTRQTQEMQP